MSMIEKNKNLFVVTLESGKQTYFNFADGNIYGVNGKVVQNFNAEAMRILKSEQNSNFIAKYFYLRTLSYSPYIGIKEWPVSLVETIYSLYAKRYSVDALGGIAEFCYKNNFKLDKKGVKILTEALSNMENDNGKLLWINSRLLENEIAKISYRNLPEKIIPLISQSTLEMRKYIIEDAEKIAFRYEHENWEYLDKVIHSANTYICPYISRYIQLCNLLHHERTYKNLFQSICMMEKERDLMADKFCLEYQKKAPLFFEDENFTVLIPTTADEFKEEADYQQNCVFRLYYPKVRNCETHVVFIRKKSDINTPYITCEVNNAGQIVQYLTRFNHNVTDDNAKAFGIAYQEYLREHFQKPKRREKSSLLFYIFLRERA